MAPLWRFYRYCSVLDIIFMLIGTLGTAIAGLGMPAFAFLFKNLMKSFNPSSSGDELWKSVRFISLMFLALGGATWFGSYLVYAFWGIVSTKVGFYYRREYLRAILKQDAAWFESFDILSLPSKVSKECLSVQAAAGEKLGNVI